ncbi:hypothetical protein [Dankookia sp. GCM10030260]
MRSAETSTVYQGFPKAGPLPDRIAAPAAVALTGRAARGAAVAAMRI